MKSAIIVIGGLGSIPGALIAGLMLGIVESLGASFLAPAYQNAYGFVLLLVVAVSGTVRGFSGFGAGMVFMPIAAALVGPKIAVIIIWLVDTLPSLGAVIVALSIILEDALILGIGSLVGVGGLTLIFTIGAAVAHVVKRAL